MRAFIKSVERRNATHKRHRRSQGGQRVYGLPKFLENIEIVCFERRFSKQNSVIRLKLNILAPSKFFATPQIFGLATPLTNARYTSHLILPHKKHKQTECRKHQRVGDLTL